MIHGIMIELRMLLHIQGRAVLLAIAVIFGVAAQVNAQRSSAAHRRLVFETATETGLSDILKQRRRALEKRAGKPLSSHAWWLWGLSTIDYDRDGDLDLIVCIHGSTNGLIIRNQRKETGKLTFVDVTQTLGVDGAVPSTDNYPLVWDMDGDGYLDIAGLFDDRSTPCLLNRGGKRFEKASYSLHPINYPEAIRDLNGDGYIDIEQTRRDKVMRYLFDPKSATFKKSESNAKPPIDLPADVQAEIAALKESKDNRFMRLSYMNADLDSDGHTDWILRAFGSYSGARQGWYFTAGKGGAIKERSKDMGLPREGAPMMAEDVDHDGDVDLLLASGKTAGLYLNDGAGHFTLKAGPLTDFVRQRCPYLHVAFRIDLDNDGDLDIAVSNRRYGRQRVFENLGKGEFALVVESKGWDADPLVLRDMNDDGLVDLVIGGAGEKENIGIFLNRTPNAGRHCALNLRMDAPNVYAVGTTVEVFHAGDVKRAGAKPWFKSEVGTDGSPMHIGLGEATTFDLRVAFPGKPVVELSNVKAAPKLTINPAGVQAAGNQSKSSP